MATDRQPFGKKQKKVAEKPMNVIVLAIGKIFPTLPLRLT